MNQNITPPDAPKHPRVTKIHGHTLTDDYYWMRERGSAAVTAYLEAEDRYATESLSATSALQETLYQEILSHVKETDETVPFRRGDYFYYSRTEKGHQHAIHCRTHRDLTAPEQVFLDLNVLAEGHTFFALGPSAVSDDGRRLAYGSDVVGYRQFTLVIKNLETAELLSEQIERVTSVVWAADNETIFYVTEDPVTKRSDTLFRHRVGTDVYDLVYEEHDHLFSLGVSRSRDRAMIFVTVHSMTSTEVRYIDAVHPLGEPTLVAARKPDHEYDVQHRDGVFYVRTNKGATNFRVVTAPVARPSEEYWTELIAHRPAVKIDRVDLFAKHLVQSCWEGGLQQLEIMELDTRVTHRVAFPEPVYSVFPVSNAEFDVTVLRYRYQSLVTPTSVFDYDMDERQATLLKQTEVPGDFDRARYRSERIFATAADGTRVPISLVYSRDVRLDGTAPLLLLAYGSYGIPMSPSFSSARLVLLDRGVICAIAHVRGGGELGEEWREQGRMMKKMNTFTDFIACAEHLVERRYTAPSGLIIEGGSAGGLLVGVVTNLRPELFKAAIALVPFVDVINTMLDASLPLTTGEYIEWGNPNDKEAFDYIMRYSPYDNVRRQEYPAMLVKVSLNDSQVPYWEGAKLVAKLRDLKTDQNPMLLKANFGAGHGGASGRYESMHELAFDYAFVLWQLGLADGPRPESVQ